MSDKGHFVYIMNVEGQDLCKIGISRNPEARRRQLNTGSPHRINMIAAFWVVNEYYARALEQGFHRVCRKAKTNGEWFSYGPPEAVARMAANYAAMLSGHFDFGRDEARCVMEQVGFGVELAEIYTEAAFPQ